MPREIEIPHEDNDYEIVPLTPLRRLEKRLEAIETTKSVNNLEKFIDKIIDMVEMNQRIVDEVVKANQGLREDISILISKIDESQSKMGEFVDIIKEAGEAESGDTMSKEFVEKVLSPLITRMEESANREAELNNQMVDKLGAIEKRLKNMQLGSGAAPSPQGPSGLLQRRRLPPSMPPKPMGQ